MGISDAGQQNQQGGMQDMREQVRNLGSTVRDTATEQYEHARDAVSQYVAEGRQRVGEYQNDIEGYIRENPLQSVLIAAGAGIVLSWLLRR
jgi:ElaB/YqjD/DUF883 family membrane-anchored ribosome-binding protein